MAFSFLFMAFVYVFQALPVLNNFQFTLPDIKSPIHFVTLLTLLAHIRNFHK